MVVRMGPISGEFAEHAWRDSIRANSLGWVQASQDLFNALHAQCDIFHRQVVLSVVRHAALPGELLSRVVITLTEGLVELTVQCLCLQFWVSDEPALDF